MNLNLCLLILILVLTACGQNPAKKATSEPSTPVTNNPPGLSGSTTFEVISGDQLMSDFSASDPEGNSLSFSLSGTDSGAFVVSSDGTVTFANRPDFDNPLDANQDNQYEVEFTVSDGALSTSLAFTVTVLEALNGRVLVVPISDATISAAEGLVELTDISGITDSNGRFKIRKPKIQTGARTWLKAQSGAIEDSAPMRGALVSDLGLSADKSIIISALSTLYFAAGSEGSQQQLSDALSLTGIEQLAQKEDFWEGAKQNDPQSTFVLKRNIQSWLMLETLARLTESASTLPSPEESLQLAKQLTKQMISGGLESLLNEASFSEALGNIIDESEIEVELSKEHLETISGPVSEMLRRLSDPNLDLTGPDAATLVQVTAKELMPTVSDFAKGSIARDLFEEKTTPTQLFSGISAENSEDTDDDGQPDVFDEDDDNDGVADALDDFPLDNARTSDLDGDGLDDAEDPDLDGDGVLNEDDRFPSDAKFSQDNDGDGVADEIDAFPDDASESRDLDGDGIGDKADPDMDGDNYADEIDAFPEDANEWIDTDADGTGDNADAFPTDAKEQLDADGDGIGDREDTDDDNDGVPDLIDRFPADAGECCDLDQDGVGDLTDAFPSDPNESSDADGDGQGDLADNDDDNDGVRDSEDDFPKDPSESVDTDGDGEGNNSDLDDDNDGLSDEEEVLLGTSALNFDSDLDGTGDGDDAFPKDWAASTDTDGDGDPDNWVDGKSSTDSTTNLIEDLDDDNDGVSDVDELASGTDPLDSDSDDDGINDLEDAFPIDPAAAVDTDGDGNPDAWLEGLTVADSTTGLTEDLDDDDDGLSDVDEVTAGTDPLDPDSDGDGIPDGQDNFPLDDTAD